jgi:hypothetical protein
MHLKGVAVDAGPLALRAGDFEFVDTPFGTRVEGRALGAFGGWVEVSGILEPTHPDAPPLRIYLDGLQLPSPIPSGLLNASGLLAADATGTVALSGVVWVRGGGPETRDIELDLRATGLRADAGGEWLRLHVRGRVGQVGGRLTPDARIEFDGELLDVGGVEQLRVFRGGLHGQLTLSGDLTAPRFGLVADLSAVRMRIGDWFEKAAGEPARVVVRGHWSGGEMSDTTAEMLVAGARLQIERDPLDPEDVWRLRSSWVPLGLIAKHAPFLRRIEADLEGRARLRAKLGPDVARARIELLGLRGSLAGRPLESRAVELQLEPAAISLTVQGVRFAGQELDLTGQIGWEPEPGPIRVALEASARQLDLAALGEALLPLLGSDDPENAEDAPLLDEFTRRAAKLLRSRPILLERLRVEPAILRVERLRGFGLDLENASVRTVLADRQLRIEQSDRTTRDRPRIYAVDLGRFVPRLEDCRSWVIAPGGLRASAARCPDLE